MNINDSIVGNNHEDEGLDNMKEDQEPHEENDPLLGLYTRVKQLTESELEKILTDKNKLLEFLTNVCI